MKIVTSGRKYLDIDAYAGVIAYRELLRALGEEAVAVSTAPFNQSVPKMIQDLSYGLDKMPENLDEAKFIVVDVSNPEFFDTFVKPEKIIEVIDHHTGFESYWKERLGDKAEIERIGSVCTMIFEKIVAAEKLEILKPDLCKLMVAGILDNTLNFGAETTNGSDLQAWHVLMKRGGLPEDYEDEYFGACYAEIKENLVKAIRDDTKIEKVSPVLPEVIGQIIVPRAEDFDVSALKVAFAEYPEWMMNVIALKDGKSYVYFSGDGIKEKLEELFEEEGDGGLIILDKFKLRKEIMKMGRECSSGASR